MSTVHLHWDDSPKTLALLHALLDEKTAPEAIGFIPDEFGAEVDWEMLESSYLSTTETGVVMVAHGCYVLERFGIPRSAREPLRDLVDRITR